MTGEQVDRALGLGTGRAAEAFIHAPGPKLQVCLAGEFIAQDSRWVRFRIVPIWI